MADESHIPQLTVEDFSGFEDKLSAWAHSLDTTPERLMDIIQRGGDQAQYVRDLLGIKSPA